MDTVSQLIESLGGGRQLARDLNLPATTVQSWSARGSIPPAYWPQIAKIGVDKKIYGASGLIQRLVVLATGGKS